jgi:hypothetical protein
MFTEGGKQGSRSMSTYTCIERGEACLLGKLQVHVMISLSLKGSAFDHEVSG